MNGYPDRVRAGTATVLATNEAKEETRKQWPRIRALYEAATEPETKDAFASTLARSVIRSTINDLIDLLEDPKRRPATLLFLRPILRMGGERGRRVVESLQEDPDLGKEARSLISKMTRPAI
jgi:hypothetical protein